MTDSPAASPAERQPESSVAAGELHALLLRLAGRASDDVVATLRDMLAHRGPAETAELTAAAVLAQEILLDEDEADVLLEEIADEALAERLRQQDRLEGPVPMRYIFAPSSSVQYTGPQAAQPTPIDLTDDAEQRSRQMDETDSAAIAALADVPSAVALWRAWRWPWQAEGDTEPVRIYLLQVDTEPNDLPGVTGRLQQALADFDGIQAQVEVFPSGAQLPTYQRYAQGASALLWVAQSTEPVQIARVFDRVDAVTGPSFDPDHPRLDDDGERARILAYLRGGLPVLATTERVADLVEPGNGDVVPLTFLTDGSWVWTETVNYYLEVHRLAPDAELLRHIQGRNYTVPEVDAVGEHRALAALFKPADEPVWTAGATA